MPVQIDDTSTQIAFASIGQTWVIAPDINAGGGVSSSFTSSTLINWGNVLSAGGNAAAFTGGNVVVHNQADALLSGFTGASFSNDLIEVHNEGTIAGFGGHGIYALIAANHVTITNSGTIFGTQGGVTIESGSALVASITNSGTINSSENGVALSNAVGAAPLVLNSGTIKGGFNSILAEAGDGLNVINTGTLIGNVVGSSPNQTDSINNSGTITGNVRLGPGIDSYKGSGRVTGTVFGEDGNDNLAGGGAADRLNGGNGVDILTGNAGNDAISGGAGNDVLTGGLGIDTLSGGLNNDFFVLNAPLSAANRDIIVDFNHVNDTFRLENAVMTGLGGPGPLNPALFFAGGAAHDANDRIVYNRATGALTYDSNGNAAGGVTLLATLVNKPVLAANDFAVI